MHCGPTCGEVCRWANRNQGYEDGVMETRLVGAKGVIGGQHQMAETLGVMNPYGSEGPRDPSSTLWMLALLLVATVKVAGAKQASTDCEGTRLRFVCERYAPLCAWIHPNQPPCISAGLAGPETISEPSKIPGALNSSRTERAPFSDTRNGLELIGCSSGSFLNLEFDKCFDSSQTLNRVANHLAHQAVKSTSEQDALKARQTESRNSEYLIKSRIRPASILEERKPKNKIREVPRTFDYVTANTNLGII